MSRHDLRILRTEDITKSSTWKTASWGRLGDEDFVRSLAVHDFLADHIDRSQCGQGISPSPAKYPTKRIKKFKLLPISLFSRYDSLDKDQFGELGEFVYRLGNEEVYSGNRILVQRGINEKCDDKGQIVARYETEPFCFTNAINGIKFSLDAEWKYETLLGILWSSLARYFFFMTSSNWGLWHHEIHLDDELLQLPVVLDSNNLLTRRVISIVDKLSSYHPQKCAVEQDLFHYNNIPEKHIKDKRRKWEAQLDEVVFELYGLNEEQKDLIRDCCEVTLPFFYKPFDSVGTMAAIEDNDYSGIEDYVNIFSRRWNVYLDDSEEMRAEVHVGAHGNMVAIEFYPADKGDSWDLKPKYDSWGYVLEEIGKSLPQPIGTSQILLDGVVHAPSENGVIIIKRNEKRFWTRSLAREDADATLCKRMVDTSPAKGRSR